MHTKWYIRISILILALVGIGLDQIAVPNQEIVVQFVDEDVTFDETQDAIAIVKTQLESIGVERIQVQKSVDGKLKITYYSDIDVVSIKNILSKGTSWNLGYALNAPSKEPAGSSSQNTSKIYELDIHEIQNLNDFESGFDGYMLEPESKSNRSNIPYVYFSKSEIDVDKRDQIDKVAYILQKTIAVAIGDYEHTIPEVRAGPVTRG